MSILEKLVKAISEQNDNKIYNYSIPDLWNVWGYDGDEVIASKFGELIVNPYSFYSELIKYIIDFKENGINYNQSISKINNATASNGDWIKESVVYSTMIRTSSSWDHDRTSILEESNMYGLKETGTFIKTIAILPLLRKMGVNTVYMLPISKYSLKDKKGECGSPYGVSNFYKIDENLKDPITGDKFTVEDEFKAFVEACHILGIRIMIDIIPRTNSVDSELILEHPDWFYWIKKSEFSNYRVPYIDGLGETLSPNLGLMKSVYESEDTLRHINMFQHNPQEQDEIKWNKIVKEVNEGKGSAVDLTEKYFDLTIAPAFSDHINDVQPPWTDVTFFRMYLDHPAATKPFLGKDNVAPYILFDSIKANLFPGNNINTVLWDTLVGIIPYYQKNFGIDGARVDMGHALPLELTRRIINEAREYDSDFSFIAEISIEDAIPEAIKSGYNMILGIGYEELPRVYEGKTKSYYDIASKYDLPVFACCETHDTKRVTARNGGKCLNRLLTITNMFMPNGIPFINSGQEVYEIQPMNLGVDCVANDIYTLPENDPFYLKLALFDKFALHYTNIGRWDIPNNLEKVSAIREKYIKDIIDLNNYDPIPFDHRMCTGFSYLINNQDLLLIIANLDPYNNSSAVANIFNIRQKRDIHSTNYDVLYSMNEKYSEKIRKFDDFGNIWFELEPGDVLIIIVYKKTA